MAKFTAFSFIVKQIQIDLPLKSAYSRQAVSFDLYVVNARH